MGVEELRELVLVLSRQLLYICDSTLLRDADARFTINYLSKLQDHLVEINHELEQGSLDMAYRMSRSFVDNDITLTFKKRDRYG